MEGTIPMTETQAAALPVYAKHDLGAVWQADRTAFRLWAPTASAVTLHRYAAGSDDEPGAADLGRTAMSKDRHGTWLAVLDGNLAGQYYQYELTFPDGSATVTADPYAKAAGINGQRSMVIDLAAAAPPGWDNDRRPFLPPHAQAIWETHVSDFSADPHSGVPKAWRGKFLAFTLEDTTLDGDGVHPTCLNYLKSLGVTHVQLQPIFEFATVDQRNGGYNWGYDPLNYNVPEGAYSTDPWHGEVRVRECRAMIAALHRAGLGVVMDVVYNHTYSADNWMERTVPGYWLRRWPDGSLTNGSGCGCDLASERTMVRRYLVDSCVYWAREYHVDGFRFDLMALHDVDTMNAIRAALDALPGGEQILLYGEPWQGGATRMPRRAVSANKQALDKLHPRIGIFCDNTRDAIKGSVFDGAAPGYVNGRPDCGYALLHALSAWRDGAGGFCPQNPRQVVQYVSAHDNFTLWDKLKCTAGRTKKYAVPDEDLLAQNRMAAGIYLTCQGLPFLLSGEEFARTRNGDSNPYRGPAKLNALDWTRAARLSDLVAYYRGLLAIRRAYPELSGQGGAEPCILSLPGWLIGFVPERPGESRPGRLAVYYNPEQTCQVVALPAGSWQTLSDGTTAAAQPFGPVRRDTITLAPVSVTILRATAGESIP